jgi:hypothetical protein
VAIPKICSKMTREDTYYAPVSKNLLYSLVYIGRTAGDKYGESTHTGLIRVAVSTFIREHEKTYGAIPHDEIEKIKAEWASKTSQGA